MEEVERPSFENFLSRPSTLTDHLTWQLGAVSVTPQVHEAAELVIGNLNEDGYLIASDDELMGVKPPAPPEADAAAQESLIKEAAALGLAAPAAEVEGTDLSEDSPEDIPNWGASGEGSQFGMAAAPAFAPAAETPSSVPAPAGVQPVAEVEPNPGLPGQANGSTYTPSFSLAELHEAIALVRQFDPPGVACRDLRECLLCQLSYHKQQLALHKESNGTTEQVLNDAITIVDQHLRALQLKQHKEIGKALGRPIEAVHVVLEYIRTLDPRPGLRYNKVQPKLIEPDVAFVKHGDEWLCLMNDEDVPQLRLNPAYKRLLTREGNDKDTRNYVKERYKSAIQLIKNIEQRKQTIMKVCYSIVARQQDFLEKGIDHLKPMMIKEVAEEIGVHPSTVSRAVANKYAHTPQGVFELRYFFSESVQGPEGGNTSLLILKRRVKKLIEEEDPVRPLTDEQITRILQSQGIQVTRRTVAKYREDMRIPSTHQRRVKK
jgi:RNA polymerase sigma-54 factor